MTIEELKQEGLKIKESFSSFREELKRQYKENLVKQAEVTEVFKAAAANGDLRENAEYATAEKELTMCNAVLASLDTQLKNIDNSVKDVNYKPIGVVVMYSTVLIKVINDREDGEEFIFRLYPEGVSDLSRKILAVDSPMGKAIWLKRRGYTFQLDHRITGKAIRWKICEIY